MYPGILKLSEYNWNYQIIEGVVRQVGKMAIICHLLFFFTLHFVDSDMQEILLRMVVVSLYIPFLFYPTANWRVPHKVYFELTVALTMPAYFSYMLMLDTTTYWAVTLIFILMFYSVFAKWQVAMVLYPLSVAGAFFASHTITPLSLDNVWEVFRIELIGLMALILVQVLKDFFEASHNAMVELKEEADKQNEIFSALLDISVEVSRFDDLDEIFSLLLKRFETIFPGRGFGLLVEGPRPRIIPYMAFRGIQHKDTTFLLQVHPYVLGFASVGDGHDEEQLSSLEGDDWQVFGGGIKSSSIKGQTLYCFKLFVKGRRLDSEERKTLGVFLETIRGMTRTRIQAIELERYSNTDHLSGLFNRNYFDRIIDAWEKKAVDEKPFSIIYGDINGLKRVNDTYGHHAGDLLIRTCAEFLLDEVRNSDLVFRMGGDEVVILCPATDLDQAAELLHRINTKLAGLVVECVDEVSGEVTEEQVYISFGMASSLEQGPRQTVALADQRMYQSKKEWYERGGISPYR
ncbi:GGDEF domain-containing protein [Desulfopila sp. IMCC35008]|uniref:sensor domain-containing diguanylate cyclase n=1 Tax=Desulfopila sp. IMCC35008 TaxID=2653858 RepID=UPI0013D7945A|nr:GGDEF domain-containing protein [Desulfopila sp. IMCC35008]